MDDEQQDQQHRQDRGERHEKQNRPTEVSEQGTLADPRRASAPAAEGCRPLAPV